ncbi:MAG TPA: acyl-CoA reductase [Longimicrobiaceae bacterium]|nr:acyl-CoA reductase [Longimicrobiaceae bacterium]
MGTPAFWLPGIGAVPTDAWRRDGEAGTAEILTPRLSGDLLRRQMASLAEAREAALATRPIGRIVATIDAVARRFLDSGDPLRREALRLLPIVTGYSPDMAELTLDRMAADWRQERLERLLAEELGDRAALDHFVDLGPTSRRIHAVGPRVVFHVFSGNVPGVAVTSLVRALLVKAASLGKTASGDPILPALFARAIAEEDAALGGCVAVAYWPGGTEALETVALEVADTVVAYGSREAIESIRGRVPPGRRLLEYGNRLSFAVVARESLSGGGSDDLAADAALAVATFDQHGCVSPHVIYVEAGGEVPPKQWARLVAEALSRVEARLPRGPVTPGEAATIQQLRGHAEMAALADAGIELHASPGSTAWTLVFETDPTFDASSLNRVVRVKPVESIEAVPGLVREFGPVLQTVGMAGPEDRLAPVALELARLGASRIAPLAEMPWPRPWWHHDGRPPLADLVRWCDWD